MTAQERADYIASAKPAPAPDMVGGDDPRGSGGAYDAMILAKECPFIPLGVTGEMHFVLDNLRQLRSVGPKLDKGIFYSLCGEQMGWLDEAFPMYKENGDVVKGKFNQDKAQRALIRACQSKGVIDLEHAERGRGSHLARNGALVFHCGNRLWIAGERMKARGKGAADGALGAVRGAYPTEPGLYQRIIFPTAGALPQPANAAASTNEMWDLLLEHFNGWNWQGPTQVSLDGNAQEECNIYAWLTFGWMISAMICGAIKRRPPLWITGPSKQGKSKIRDSMVSFLGEGWCVAHKDMSPVSIFQLLGKQRLPVLFDESEARDEDPAFMKNLLTVALLSFDGSSRARGTADHKGVTQEIYASMQMSSVLPPKMRPQDRNRMIMVDVGMLTPAMHAKGYREPAMVAALGPKARRRMCDRWSDFEAIYGAYETEMMARGYDGREIEAYVTVLACADIMLFDSVPVIGADSDGRCKHIIDCLKPILGAAREDNEDHPELAVQHLLNSQLIAGGGEMTQSVSQWIWRAVIEDGVNDANERAHKLLQAHGMRLCNLKAGHEASEGGVIAMNDIATAYLAVAGQAHPGIAKIFHNSEFNQGRHLPALRRLKYQELDANGLLIKLHETISNKKPKFGGHQSVSALVPLIALFDLKELSNEVRVARAAKGHPE